MRVMSNGKVWRSKAEWRTICERFTKSGLGQQEFCRREAIAVSSFKKWQRRYGASRGQSGARRGRSSWSCRVAYSCLCEAGRMWTSPGVRRVLAYREPVDLRKSFPGLVGLVKSMLAEDPLLGSVFVFINRRETLIKSTPPVGTLDVLYCRSLQ